MATQDDLYNQIMAQNLTSKWSGQGLGSVEANARDMARILAEIGLNDIKEFGRVKAYEPLLNYADTTKDFYKGSPVQYTEDGQAYVNLGDTGGEGPTVERLTPEQIQKLRGKYDLGAEGGTRFSPLDESRVITRDGEEIVRAGETFGNKLTGKEVPRSFGENQIGNFFGGTYEGSDRTGYGVEFGPDGTPYFYTQNVEPQKWYEEYAPFLAIAALALGMPPLGEAAAVGGATAGGAGLGLTAAEAAGLGLTASEAASLGLSASEYAAATAAGAAGSAGVGAGMLESVFDPTFGGQLAPVIGGGAESVFDPTSGGSALDAGMNAYPSTGNIGAPKPITLSDAKRALDVANKVSKVVGGNAPAGTAKTAGTAGANTFETALSNLLQQQTSNAALLNILGSEPKLANIKSYKELFGEGLFGDSYVPPSAGGEQAVIGQYADSASQNEGEQQLFRGGRVDDFDALLQILRS